MDIINLTRKLAKQNKYQSIFTISKEFKYIRIFKNTRELSKLQEIFLNYLYVYDNLNQDLMMKKVSKHIFDYEIYEDSYLMWKREKSNKPDDREDKTSDVKLIISDKINFPKR